MGPTTILTLVAALVLAAALAVWLVAMIRNRRGGPRGASGAEAPSPLVAWAHERGVEVREPAPAGFTYPEDVQPARMRPERCLRIIGDLDRDGFTAQTWSTERSNLGGLPLRGEDVVLRVAAGPDVPRLAIGHVDLLPQAELSLPRQFADGPITREDELVLTGEVSPTLEPALREVGPRIGELGEWVIAQPGSVTLLLSSEPRSTQDADRCLQLARDVAARLSTPDPPSA